MLTSFAPAMLLFGVTSADYAFAGLGMVVACLLVRRAGWAVVPGGCAATVATFFSWLLFAIPASAALVVLQRDGWRAAARVCLAAGAGVIVFNAALAIAVASVLGFTRGETERIWLAFTPLACVAAAAVVPVSRLRPVLTILAVHALAVEVQLFTVW